MFSQLAGALKAPLKHHRIASRCALFPILVILYFSLGGLQQVERLMFKQYWIYEQFALIRPYFYDALETLCWGGLIAAWTRYLVVHTGKYGGARQPLHIYHILFVFALWLLNEGATFGINAVHFPLSSQLMNWNEGGLDILLYIMSVGFAYLKYLVMFYIFMAVPVVMKGVRLTGERFHFLKGLSFKKMLSVSFGFYVIFGYLIPLLWSYGLLGLEMVGLWDPFQVYLTVGNTLIRAFELAVLMALITTLYKEVEASHESRERAEA